MIYNYIIYIIIYILENMYNYCYIIKLLYYYMFKFYILKYILKFLQTHDNNKKKIRLS